MDQEHQDEGQANGTNHKPLSCSSIAALLKRNPVSVFRAIQRLGLQPELETDGGYKFYPYAAVETIRGAMRKPNRNKVTSTEVALS